MNVVEAYINAFNRCYPHKMCEVKAKRIRGELKFRVMIDQDGGDLMLSEDDLRYATRMFLRGK